MSVEMAAMLQARNSRLLTPSHRIWYCIVSGSPFFYLQHQLSPGYEGYDFMIS
jgi:hypothetical protein